MPDTHTLFERLLPDWMHTHHLNETEAERAIRAFSRRMEILLGARRLAPRIRSLIEEP